VRLLHERLVEGLGDDRRVANIGHLLRMHHVVAGHDLDAQAGRLADNGQDGVEGRRCPELAEDVSHAMIGVSAGRRAGVI